MLWVRASHYLASIYEILGTTPCHASVRAYGLSFLLAVKNNGQAYRLSDWIEKARCKAYTFNRLKKSMTYIGTGAYSLVGKRPPYPKAVPSMTRRARGPLAGG
jgi:hypothetical protein